MTTTEESENKHRGEERLEKFWVQRQVPVDNKRYMWVRDPTRVCQGTKIHNKCTSLKVEYIGRISLERVLDV